MHNIIIVYILLNGLFACQNHHNVMHKTHFRYYDINSLEGLEPLSEDDLSYPFVSIISTQKNKIITHYFSKKDSLQSMYTIVGDSYERTISNWQIKAEGKIQEYTFKDSIVVITKDAASDMNLYNIGIYSHDTLKIFGFQEPSIDSFDCAKAIEYIGQIVKGIRQTIIFSEERNKVLLSYDSKFIENSKLFYSKKFEFDNKNRTLNWWLIFKWKYYLSSIYETPEKLIDLGVKVRDL